MLNKLIFFIHNNSFFKNIFKTLNYCVESSLKDCDTALDIGCGPDSPIKHCKNLSYTVGVESFKRYIEISKKKKIHTKYINQNIFDLKFEENSFDAVLMIDIIEHMEKDKAKELIVKATKWAKKKVIVSTPNGFVQQAELDGNPLQKHLCGFTPDDLNSMGFKCKGMAGLKIFRKDQESLKMDGELLSNIRFKPKIFFFILAAISQIIFYWFPKFSFSLFAIKLKK